MNFNEFTFEKLFESPEFERYKSPELRNALRNITDFIDEKFDSDDEEEKFNTLFGDCYVYALDSGFEYGFRFAVNIMKFMYKI